MHHSLSLHALRNGVAPAPVHVQLILSDLCNQDCSFCAYRMSSGLSSELFKTAETHNPNRQIPVEKAREIIDDCAELGVKAIQFTGGGEPTVHKHHAELFMRARINHMQTALVTNGIKLSQESVNGHTWIRISVDAGDADTYAKIRRVSASHWNKVWANIENLDFGDTVLGIGFVVTPDNYKGIYDCAARARDAGAKNIRVGAVFSKAGTSFYPDIQPIIDEIDRAKVLETEDFQVVDLFGRRISDLEARPTQKFCGYQYFTTYIGGDLSVYRCCNTAYTPKGYLGSLKNQRFRDFEPAFEPFDARKCQFCQFNGQNEAINAALRRPDHVNFV